MTNVANAGKGAGDGLPAVKILFVCTGNICRSPTAQAVLTDRLKRVHVPARIRSAGLLEQDGPPPPGALKAASQLGLDMSEHRSRRIDRQLISDADLVVGMAREHVREVVVAVPAAWPKTFTFKELVRRGSAAGLRLGNETLQQWLARVHEGRVMQDMLGDSPDDDVADPMGGSAAQYNAAAAQIVELADHLVALAWPKDSTKASQGSAQ